GRLGFGQRRDSILALAVISEAGSLEDGRPEVGHYAAEVRRLSNRLAPGERESVFAEERLLAQAMLRRVQHVPGGANQRAFGGRFSCGRGHVLELECDDVDPR